MFSGITMALLVLFAVLVFLIIKYFKQIVLIVGLIIALILTAYYFGILDPLIAAIKPTIAALRQAIVDYIAGIIKDAIKKALSSPFS